MRQRLETWLIALFLTGSISLLVWFNLSKPRILILHSYDQGYSWVKDVNTGIRRVLDKRGDLTLRWYYLDTKRHPWPEFKENAGRAARRLIDETQPDILIAIDDDAQAYVARHYLDHPHIAIVFAGVNNDPARYGYDTANNVSGILERLPLAALKETLDLTAARSGLPAPLRLRFIGDRSETVLGDEHTFRHFNWAPYIVQPARLVDTWPEWQRAVEESAADTDVLIVSNYRRLTRSAKDSTLVPAREVIAWTEAHAKPLFIGTNAFFAEDGGMLAIGTSPYEQGEVAARLATAQIDPGYPPPQRQRQRLFAVTRQFVVALRGSTLQARHLDLPSVYEASARASNKYFE